MRDSKKKCERLKRDIERQRSLGIGFGKLGERLSESGASRQIMQRTQRRKKDNINKNHPTISEGGNACGESAISTKDGPNLEDLELAHDEQSETIKGRDAKKQSEVPEAPMADEAGISILGGCGNREIPHDAEMQVSTVNKVHRSRNGEQEVDVPNL